MTSPHRKHRLVQIARVLLVVVGLAAMGAAVVVAAIADPSQILLDIFYSVTGFCGGFLYATYLFHPSRPTRGPRGFTGPRGPSGENVTGVGS